jgi:mannose-6-phosphate isomerase
MSLEPLVVQGVLHETIWGGYRLAAVAGKALPPGATIGESWETALDSPVLSPLYRGLSLGAVSASLGTRLYGTRAREVCGERFPLLAKFIDAHAWLSVQVHPDDAYAAAHEGGKLGKTEAWRILRAEDDAAILHGFVRPTSRDEVAAAVAANRLEELAARVPVSAGDAICNPAGTLHATGAGIVLYEIQEYSDITYRLYDFGRVGADGQPRPLHVGQALDVLSYEPIARHVPRALLDERDPRRSLRVACRHFALAETALDVSPSQWATDGSSCHIVTAIAGSARLAWGDDSTNALTLELGQTVVVPAEPLPYTLTAAGNGAVALTAWVPREDDRWVRAWNLV